MRCLPLLCLILPFGMAIRGNERQPDVQPPVSLKDTPANTWVKVVESNSGGREQPVFVYAPRIKRFVTAAGMQHYGGERPRHYDTEEFDLGLRKWFNAYPPGREKDRPASGPVGEDYARERAKHGYNGGTPFYKDGDHLRVGAGGQWHDGKTYGEYCYVPDGGKAGWVYAYLWNKTLRYDIAEHTWKDLETTPRDKCRLWGSLCYDPVNKEILHAGGKAVARTRVPGFIASRKTSGVNWNSVRKHFGNSSLRRRNCDGKPRSYWAVVPVVMPWRSRPTKQRSISPPRLLD